MDRTGWTLSYIMTLSMWQVYELSEGLGQLDELRARAEDEAMRRAGGR